MSERLRSNPSKVLIVEDSLAMITTFKYICGMLGLDAVAVGSVQEAKEVLREGEFSIIITDGLDGKWEEVVESAGKIPVVLCTNHDYLNPGADSFEAAAEEKGVRFLGKLDDNFTVSLMEILNPDQ